MEKPISRRRFLGTSAMAAGAAAIGAPAVLRAQTPKLKCGVVTSLSGKDQFGGNFTKQGYQFWAETVNAQGGFDFGGERYEVEMHYGDAQSKPSSGADAAARLAVQEEVDVLFGPYTSGVTLAVQPISAKHRIPMISGSAESPEVWLQKPPFNFGMIPSVDLSAGEAVHRIIDSVGSPTPKTAAVVGVNEPFSKETAEGFRAGVEGSDLDLLHYELFPAKADLTPIVSKIANEDPDILAVGAHEEVLINMVKAMKQLNFRPKALIMHYGVTAATFAEELGDAADGVFGITMWTPDVPFADDLFGSAAEYDRASAERWDSHPDYTEVACSASGLVLMDAAKRMGKPLPWTRQDRMQLAEAIGATEIETCYAPVAFETSGPHFHCNTRPKPVLAQIQNGDVVPVAPAEAAKGDIIYPLPS